MHHVWRIIVLNAYSLKLSIEMKKSKTILINSNELTGFQPSRLQPSGCCPSIVFGQQFLETEDSYFCHSKNGRTVTGAFKKNYLESFIDLLCHDVLFTRWWFQTFFICIPTWGDDPIQLIFFKWVGTTN